MNPQSNESLLRRRLLRSLNNFEPRIQSEIADLLITSVCQLPASHSRYIRNANSDLFCPFCGELHKLVDCTREGVVEYRVDPTAWMREHIPAGLMHSMAKVEVRSKRTRKEKGNVQTLNKTQEFDKMKEVVAAVPEPSFDLVECPVCSNLVQPYADGSTSGHQKHCPNA